MSLATSRGPVDVSVLVPAKDEAENLPEFVRQTAEALRGTPFVAELVVVDDGSRDDSARVLEQLAAEYNGFLKVERHRTQQGIMEALNTGSAAARGDVFVFYPADLQFVPAEIPQLVAPILADEADLVTGAKQGAYEKAFVSSVYNRLCRRLFGVNVTDLNSVKAYRREVFRAVPARPDWHRYLAVIAGISGYRLAERPVTLHQRRAGRSKFGMGRIPIGVIDLVSVWFQVRFGRRPMLFFGVLGSVLVLLGFLTGLVALYLRFVMHIGFRPLLNLIETLIIAGIALFGFGFIGELLAGMREELREVHRIVTRRRSGE